MCDEFNNEWMNAICASACVNDWFVRWSVKVRERKRKSEHIQSFIIARQKLTRKFIEYENNV